MSALIWVHDDDLSPVGPALSAEPMAPAVYIFDPQLMVERGYGLKRAAFIHESLAALGDRVQAYRGSLGQGLVALARQAGADRVITSASPCPFLRQTMESLRAHGLSVDVREPVPLVAPAKTPDLKRFSRYWRRAEATAFKPTGLAPGGTADLFADSDDQSR